MNLLEISAASINSSAPSIIFFCLIISAVAFMAFIFKERLQKFNAKHHLMIKDNNAVIPSSWNGGSDGIDAEGVPYYGLSGTKVKTEEESEAVRVVVRADENTSRDAA